jgi:hypothetical protein
MNIRFLFIIFCFVFILSSCSSKSENQNIPQNINQEETLFEHRGSSEASNCNYEDGIYSSSVVYFNPKTGHSNTYTLEFEVQDCEVIQFNFPNGGWLDSDHIFPSELDENGYCVVNGENGKTYEIQIL